MKLNKFILPKLKIGELEISPPLILAPMAGITNHCFRKFIASMGGCGLFFTEMISSEGLIRNNQKTLHMLKFSRDDQPLFCQIFGSRPEVMGEASKILKEMGVKGIDINMSCPKEKVVRKLSGVYLMRNIKLAEKILVKVVKEAYPLPITIKIRAGWSKKEINAVEFSKMAESTGVSAIIIHPRTRSEFFSSKANWELIGDIKKNVSIPVIGNGDIKKPEDIYNMFTQTGCNGVMIGRGAIQDPLIFRKFMNLMHGESSPFPSKKIILLNYIELLEKEDLTEREKINHFKKLIVWGSKGFEKGKILRKEIIFSGSLQEIKEKIEKIL
ncbi:tRNA dihydrouridine synthase DusB [Candidatus Aminicenantes bacterium AC-335-A11]|nr:tRNA dihydrouridine synthase DusB [SCandidatus Aminicenantes bacterium Aminicenantia_JdfR_composite]MCP2597144.1 tRNA dihydrouridine synthase DusB [Candidatus Aminicenantes bacterium AC-335-G13]MCP2617987.1 tRNA dihydrouridine synthase DusB [Candidatus Aminicenantes bacterium AC-335-A11]